MAIQAAALYGTVSIVGAGQSVGDLNRVSGAVNRAQSTMSRLGANAGQMAHGVGQVAGGLVRIGELAAVALGGAMAASARAASSYQAQVTLIETQAGARRSEMLAQSKAILDLAHSVGAAPIELAKGMYHIESVGIRGAEALAILRAGALGAATGLASLEETTNALTAVAYSGIGGVTSMTQAMGALDAIVGVGNMRLQDLVDSFGTGILGTSKTFGVGLREMGAALAVLTDAGVKAQPAATRMQMMFTHMAAPVPGAIKVLKNLGLSQFALAEDLRKPDGIFVALTDLRTHLIKAGEAVLNKDGTLRLLPKGTADVSKLFGGSRFGAAAMQLLGMADRIKQKYDKIGEQQAMFGQRVASTMETTHFRWTQFLGDLQTAAIRFGEQINPALARALGHIDTMLMARMPDIVQFGKEAGAAIDKIDWRQVEAGAASFVDLLRGAVDLLSKIPPNLLIIGAGFLAVNKLSGGLLGAGIGNIAGGFGKGIGNLALNGISGLLSKIPGIGGALAGATAMRVFVVNMPLGGFGGGIPGVGGAGGVGGAFGTALKLLPWVAFGALIAEGFIQGNKDHPEAYGTGRAPGSPAPSPWSYGPRSALIDPNNSRYQGGSAVDHFQNTLNGPGLAGFTSEDRFQAKMAAAFGAQLRIMLRRATAPPADLMRSAQMLTKSVLQAGMDPSALYHTLQTTRHNLGAGVGDPGRALNPIIEKLRLALVGAATAAYSAAHPHAETRGSLPGVGSRAVADKLETLRQQTLSKQSLGTAATQAVGRGVEAVHQAILSRPPVTHVDIGPTTVNVQIDGRNVVSATILSQQFTRVGSNDARHNP